MVYLWHENHSEEKDEDVDFIFHIIRDALLQLCSEQASSARQFNSYSKTE